MDAAVGVEAPAGALPAAPVGRDTNESSSVSAAWVLDKQLYAGCLEHWWSFRPQAVAATAGGAAELTRPPRSSTFAVSTAAVLVDAAQDLRLVAPSQAVQVVLKGRG